MKESFLFRTTKGEAGKNNESAETESLTVDGRKETGQKPMKPKDHFLSLRKSIQEKTIAENTISSEEQERAKLLSELILRN